MASFSDRFPRAVHVLPLHALPGILRDGALLGKNQLHGRDAVATRRTSASVDGALGLGDYVHFYLVRREAAWERIPILAAQLLGDREPPFPHVALETDTGPLTDDECTVCLWNIAVSRPAVSGVCKGGNWTRGTDPERIVSVWEAFRGMCPDIRRARGFWNEPVAVPTLVGRQIVAHMPLFSAAASGIPELLLKSPVALRDRFTLWMFSDADRDVLSALPIWPPGLRIESRRLPSYESGSTATEAWRQRIARYFIGDEPFPIDLDFDRRR